MSLYPIRFCTLASGSSGNVAYLDSPEGAILVDAGISATQVAERLSACRFNIANIKGLLITHNHSDHIKAAGAITRRYKIPLFMTPGTAAAGRKQLGKVEAINCFQPGSTLRLGGFEIHSVPTPHDAPESVALIFERGKIRIGFFTDLGHSFELMRSLFRSLDAVILESNYDPDMLTANREYPEFVKQRIRGPHGHLANEEAASLLCEHASERMQAVLLAHLSEKNNHPRLAMESHQRIASDFLATHQPLIEIAPRHQPSKIFVISGPKPAGK
ncbi:MAG: MBL fold metallo-hydrolase [Planctomycetes bacterium]|nr:MBL fold metallo-hydrolase [Planctomycetota bacterium]